MVTKIEPKPNTFYKKKDLDDDIGVMPLYGDAYVGVTSTYDIVSSPNSTYYLGESTVITEDEFSYGEGYLSECYLNIYANTLSQLNPQTAPWVDVYGLRTNLDFTEGNLALISGSDGTGPISVFSSAYDFTTPWLTEDFDGRNKFFMDAPSRYQPGFTRTESTNLFISVDNYWRAILSSPKEWVSDPDTWFDRRLNDLAWIGSKTAEGTYGLGVRTLEILGVKPHHKDSIFPLTDAFAGGVETRETRFDNQVTLYKKPDGLYYLLGGSNIAAAFNIDLGSMTDVENEGHTKGWWLARGATRDTGATRQGVQEVQYSNFDETYIARCTQYNSLFSNVFIRANARDIKAETTGDTGDNTKFLAYGLCNLVSDDVATEGNALRMKLLWENYSGTTYVDTTGSNVIVEGANYFGWNSTQPSTFAPEIGGPGTKHPLPQAIFCTTRGIPQPAVYDITTPSLSSSIAPEVEIRFKVAAMPVAPYVYSGTNFEDDRARELSRSFSVIFHYAPLASSSTDPHITENLVDTGLQSDVVSGAAAIVVNFSKMKQGNKIDVLGILQDSAGREYSPGNIVVSGNCIQNAHWSDPETSRGWPAGVKGTNGIWLDKPPGSAAATAAGLDKYHTQIPEGEWVTMRIKMWTPDDCVLTPSPDGRVAASGSKIIAYFPDLQDENGQMRFVQVYNLLPMGPSGVWPSNMTLWTNNMRSINEVPGENDPFHVNNLYTKIDDNPDDDKITDILVDSINFYGWGAATTNASVNLENGAGSLLKLPNTKGVPAKQINNSISHGSGPGINYYGDFTHPIASYLSFGYDSSSSAVKNHKLLFNNYFSVTPQNAQEIPYLKAGYFTSGNYCSWVSGSNTGSPSWYTNLTIGVSSTASGAGDNIQVGGDDNYIDGFRQKGLMGVSGGFGGTGVNRWIKTGNPYVGAKILTISADGTEILVDKPQIFDTDQDDRFVIEVWGGKEIATDGDTQRLIGYNYEEWLNGSGSIGYVTPLRQSQKRNSGVIYLNQSIILDDQGASLGTPTNSVSEIDAAITAGDYNLINNNARLIISPYKYWINIAAINAAQTSGSGGVSSFGEITYGSGYAYGGNHDLTLSGTDDNKSAVVNVMHWGSTPFRINYIVSGGTDYSVGEELLFVGGHNNATVVLDGIAAPWGDWYNQVSGGGATTLQARNYNSVVAISGGSIKGTTYNEILYNDGIYSNRWNLNVDDPTNQYVLNQINFSYGVVTEPEEGEPGINLELGGGMGYIQRDFLLSGQNYINLSNYVRVTKPKAGDDFNFMVVPTYMSTDNSFYRMNVDTTEGTNKAQMIYGIRDMPPVISNLKVSPNVDFLKEGADIYNNTKGTATDIKFEWDEEGNKVWYRMLWIDTQSVDNKYHKAQFIAPLNDEGVTATYYRSASDYALGTSETFGTLTGANTPDIEGSRGFGSKFDGATLLTSSADIRVGGADNFTHSFYLRPTTSGTFFCASGSSGTENYIWRYSISGSKVRADIPDDEDSRIRLLSTTTYEQDGIQPLSVIVTYDKVLYNNNLKLYVNGRLEDTADYSTSIQVHPYKVAIGGYMLNTTPASGNHFFSGFIEEVNLHSATAYVPPDPALFVHKTQQLDDISNYGLSTNTSNIWNARLFVFDYHNIRGFGRTSVATSDQVGWKVTAI